MHIEVEQIEMRFHVYSSGIYPDGNVALQQQAFVMQCLDRLAQLFVAVVLQEEMDLCAVAVALGAILGIVEEPIFVFLDELLVFSGAFQRFPLLVKSDLEILPFGFQHLGIIDGCLFVEHRPHPLESCVFFDV